MILKENNCLNVMKNIRSHNPTKEDLELELEEICMQYLQLSNLLMDQEETFLSENTQRNKSQLNKMKMELFFQENQKPMFQKLIQELLLEQLCIF